jgi:hypothetical protein
MRFFALLEALCLASFPAPAASPLRIIHAGIQEMEDGANALPGSSFVPGQSVFFSFQIDGYQVSPDKKIKVGYEVDVFDPQGVRVMETIESNVDAALADEDKDWKPKVRHQIVIPPISKSGTYKIVARVKDDLNGGTAEQSLTFEVRAREVAPSDRLAVRNFHFYRGEDDNNPLAHAAYRPGDTVWARFDIVGYKYGDKNLVDVEYGISVVTDAGKVLFSQPQAAVEKSASFYPKPYVPGSMNLSLQKNIHPGRYGIVLTVRDHVGNQTCEVKEAFNVE